MLRDTTDVELLSFIKDARSRNNINWMEILEIALKHAPAETKAVLKRINTTDIDIAYYTQRLAHEDQSPSDRA